jgi:hypothetical protein
MVMFPEVMLPFTVVATLFLMSKDFSLVVFPTRMFPEVALNS